MADPRRPERNSGSASLVERSARARAGYIPQPKTNLRATVASMADRRAALAKRLGLTGPAGEANTNGTVAAAE